jgi:CRP-like cAMP-binding protein
MSHDARQQLLANLDFFSGCTEDQLRDISRLTEERSVTEGTVLCRQGAFENDVFVIVSGQAEVIIDGARVGTTHVGEIVGELAMLDRGRRAATVHSLTPMQVLVLDPEEIDSVMAADPSSAQRLSQHGVPGQVEE